MESNQCTFNWHLIILGLLILFIGSLAGYINYLRNMPSPEDKVANKYPGREKIRYILTGVGAAILVPLLLNMLSSSLIKKTDDYDPINYFVFAGFCFVAGYFSDRFIDSIGERVLNELKETKKEIKSNETKIEATKKQLEENKEQIETLIENEAEPNDVELNKIEFESLSDNSQYKDIDLKTYMFGIINAFKGNYKFRTVNGIAKELNYPETMVEVIFNSIERLGIAKKFTKENGDELWSLTQVGRLMINKADDKNDDTKPD